MDATLSYGMPRVNQSGTLLEGIALWGELKPLLTQEALVERALAYCDWAVARDCSRSARTSTSAIRGCSRSRRCCTCASSVKPYLDLQLVAFPQDGVLRSTGALEQPEARAGDGRRRRRRHSAFRAHDGRRRGERAHPVRARGGARAASSTCIATRPTTRIRGTSRRSRVQAQRLGLAGPRHRLAPDVDALDGQLLRVEADSADGRGRRRARSPIR